MNELVRGTWRDAVARDDLGAARARERAILASFDRRAKRSSRLVLACAVVAALVALAFLRMPRPASFILETTVASVPVAPSVPVARAVVVVGSTMQIVEPETAIAAGVTIDLGWSDEPSGSKVAVTGPARLSLATKEIPFIHEGLAFVRARRPIEVRAPKLRARAHDAEFRLAVAASGTRVEGVQGEVSISFDGAPDARVVRAGQSVLFANGLPPSAESEYKSAVAALWAGRRSEARAALQRLATRTLSPSLAARVCLRLGEILLADGDREAARPLLTKVAAHGPEPLAWDATLLLARAEPDLRRRAELLRSFAKTHPSYRIEALLGCAEALVAAGDQAAARSAVSALWDEPLTAQQQKRLDAVGR